MPFPSPTTPSPLANARATETISVADYMWMLEMQIVS